MKLSNVLLTIAGLALIITGFSQIEGSESVIFEDGTEVFVEIAKSPSERAQGLMHREYLNENEGMLFIFDDENIRSFWMKNTLIPLDMIFINSNWEIVDILIDVSPCEADPCPSYLSSEPAMYVLEVNAGFSEEKGLDLGDLIQSK